MDLKDWPRPYVDGDVGAKLRTPTLSRQQCIDLGNALAKALINNQSISVSNPSDPAIPPNPTAGSPFFADGYLILVKMSQRQTPVAYLQWYRPYIDHVVKTMKDDKRQNAPPVPDITNFNEHDFSNAHRAAWLSVLRALSRLVAFNPLSVPKRVGTTPNQWGDPQGTPSARGVDIITKHGDFFFRVPHLAGYYALLNSDFNDSENSVLKLGDPPEAILPSGVKVEQTAHDSQIA